MIAVNGKEVEWKPGMTVRSMLEQLNFTFPLIIIKIDGVHVKKDDYDTTPIPDGAQVSAVHLISGG